MIEGADAPCLPAASHGWGVEVRLSLRAPRRLAPRLPGGVHRGASRCVIRLVWPVRAGAAPAKASCRSGHRGGGALRVSNRCRGGSLPGASSWPGGCGQAAGRLTGRWSDAGSDPAPEEVDPVRMNQPLERPPAGVTTSTQAARTRRAVPDASRSGVACQARQTLTASTSPFAAPRSEVPAHRQVGSSSERVS